LICSLERAFSLAFQGTGEVNVVFEMIWWHILKQFTTKILTTNSLKKYQRGWQQRNTSTRYIDGRISCQPFSIAGLQAGFDDERSNVFWKILYNWLSQARLCYFWERKESRDPWRPVQNHNGQSKGYFIRYKVLNTAEITEFLQHRKDLYVWNQKTVFDEFSLDS
jgi:hypothetical protein